MKFYFTCCVFAFYTVQLCAQNVIDFEGFNLESESFLNGADESGGFSVGAVFLPNDYNPDFGSWTGWAISNTTDVTTPGFMNQFSAFPGSGLDGSAHYAVAFSYSENIMNFTGEAAGQPISGMYITNSTYAYLSMQEGDAFAKRFGGITGNDPDFFLLTIKAYSDGVLSADSVDFYLADFRFADNSQDYIVDEWTFVDLSTLGAADSLSFQLTSSDVGQFGMNTPAYFCVDNIFATELVSSTTSFNSPTLFEVFPNPTTNYVQIKHSAKESVDCTIFNMEGKLVLRQTLGIDGGRIDVQFLPKGSYLIHLQGDHIRLARMFLKY
ncbi:MAG: DUF4465 domain-containing protein [Bacteroidota bacterium]